MAKLRRDIPKALVDGLLVANNHTCCICNLHGHVEIHHIDSNPSNNSIGNLAVLCRNCHSRVSGNEGLGRHYAQGEVLLYKRRWESACQPRLAMVASVDDAENDEAEDFPMASDHHVMSLDGDTHIGYPYDLLAGARIVASVSSNVPVNFFLVTKRSYCRYENGDDYWTLAGHDSVYSTEFDLTISEEGGHAIVVENESEDEAIVAVDITVWEDGD
jgi:hypothetical protein